MAESWPSQYFARVVSERDGCHLFGGYSVAREGRSISIDILNLEDPAGRDCTDAVELQETRVPLGSDFEPGVAYAVHVNDAVTHTFVAQ